MYGVTSGVSLCKTCTSISGDLKLGQLMDFNSNIVVVADQEKREEKWDTCERRLNIFCPKSLERFTYGRYTLTVDFDEIVIDETQITCKRRGN